MSQKCDQKYFELIFLLRENMVIKFKFEFKKFILMHKKYFGEYWTTAIKLSAQLLFTVAVDQDLYDIKEFILLELKDPDIKKPFTISFYNVREFDAIFNEELKGSDKKTYVGIEKRNNIFYLLIENLFYFFVRIANLNLLNKH